MPADTTVRVSLPAWMLALGGLFGFLILGLLTFQVIMLEDQRTTIDRQLEINARQSARAIPLIDQTRPLIDEARGALPATKELGRSALDLTETLSPLARELRDTDVARSLQAAGTLASTLVDADVGEAARATRALAAELLRTDLPLTAEYARAVGGELLYKHRLRRTLLRSLHVLGQTKQLDTVPKVTRANEIVARYVPEQTRLLRRSLAVQETTLEQLEEALEVVRETERHAESLDRKTGGTVPGSGG